MKNIIIFLAILTILTVFLPWHGHTVSLFGFSESETITGLNIQELDNSLPVGVMVIISNLIGLYLLLFTEHKKYSFLLFLLTFILTIMPLLTTKGFSLSFGAASERSGLSFGYYSALVLSLITAILSYIGYGKELIKKVNV